MTSAPLVALLACLAIATPPLALADHWQTVDSEVDVRFDHRGGNEWWVQVRVSTTHQYTDFVDVWARDDGGAWVRLEKKSWGDHAASFHVEPGHRVQFRASEAGGLSDIWSEESCWFTHPAGVEQCDPRPGPADAVFTPRGGTHAIGVHVAWEKNVTGVTFDVPPESGGALEKGSDPGVWYRGTTDTAPHIVVRFHAEAETGETATSACYRWPEMAVVPCPAPYNAHVFEPFEPSPGTIAVEAYGEPSPTGVDVRIDGGTFHAMSRAESGDFRPWTYSGVPTDGDHVAEFRVNGPDGRVRCDEFGYHWPPDEEHSRVGVDGPIVFANPTGNANWVQINTYGVPRIVAVEAHVNNGEWQPLRLRSHCDWAAGISAPSGSGVLFRAIRPDLSVEFERYTWPPGSDQPPAESADTYYDHEGGNDWWVEVDIDWDSKFPDEVEACDATGECKHLAYKSWGHWAGSFHIDGAVRFRATASGSMSNVYDEWSCWFTHPEGRTPTGGEVCAGTLDRDQEPPTEDPPTEDPSSSFDATFRNVRGNDWWVETDVSATGGTLSGVDARVDGGSWLALEKKSWGSWARSFHVADGASVEFRARATDGSTDVSGKHVWPPG